MVKLNQLGDDHLSKFSPLCEYWNSSQSDQVEMERILKVNKNSPFGILFSEEPYKWENLFQITLREIFKGNYDSIKAFKIILDSVNEETRNIILNKIQDENILNHTILCQIRSSLPYHSTKKRNIIIYLRTLFTIFVNPYGLQIKRKKKHIYEYSGYLINEIARIFFRPMT